MTDHLIFNRKRVRDHRDRAAHGFENNDFLLREIASRLADRLPDITRTFPLALDLGAHTGLLAEYLPRASGIETLVQTDLSVNFIKNSRALRAVADEEFLPFAENTFDLVMSAGSLHWVNDVPGTLIQINRILKPDGLFLAILPGGETLKELRHSLEQSELTINGGISPRISPFIDVKDAGSLLQRAGFSMPVTDSETITVSYEHPLKLLQDLRGMGETNAMSRSTSNFTNSKILFAAMEYYAQHFVDEEGRIPATLDLVTLTGWKQNVG